MKLALVTFMLGAAVGSWIMPLVAKLIAGGVSLLVVWIAMVLALEAYYLVVAWRD